MDAALLSLGQEDPTFRTIHDQETGQRIVSGMGELHLEILVDRIRREFNVVASVGKPQVAFRESIAQNARAEGRFIRQTGGRGQYGHVWLEVEPRERGAGFQFLNRIQGGAIPREFFRAIETGVREALETGPKSGYPLVDIQVALVDGSYHDVDSSEIAFKIAGSMALKDAVQRARPFLLEPIMQVEAIAPGDYLGDVLGDLNSRRAQIRGVEGRGDLQIIQAYVPLAEMMGYATQIRSLTQGRATHSMEFGHYAGLPENIANNTMARVS